MAIFRFFKMAAAAILDFQNFKFLMVILLKRVEVRGRAKFGRNWSNIGGAFCSTPQSLADAHYLTAVQ